MTRPGGPGSGFRRPTGQPGSAAGAGSQVGAGARVGIDVGGTFTDLVVLDEGRLRTVKVPTTPRDPSRGVLAALGSVGLAGEPASTTPAVRVLAHGTTVATNALLERTGARTALVTTDGFRDVLEIGRQQRPALYDLTRDRPPALVPRHLRRTVRERMGPHGVLVPLDDASLRAVVAALRTADVQAVAVCLLFAFLHPEHERAVGDLLRRALPGVHVSLSHELLPEVREYERTATTVADAYLTPLLAGYLDRLAAEVRALRLPVPLVMQSSGGVAPATTAMQNAARFVLSGPAAGVVGAAWVARRSGYEDVLTLDMGGTSADVSPVVGGRVQTTTDSVIAGVPIKFPMVDVRSIGAGGGSIGWVDSGGALRVGPQSAGADPGPACYGNGGPPTVTDANLLLGRLTAGRPLGGAVVLHEEPAAAALAALGRPIGLSVVETAHGVVRVAEAEMAAALRVISVGRGFDPRRFALLAFGGAGGLHACAVAEELGVRQVLVPAAGGVLSALGLALADLRRDDVRPLLGGVGTLTDEEVETGFAALERGAAAALHQPRREAPAADGSVGAQPADRAADRPLEPVPVLERRADLRYRGQSFELTVSGRTRLALAEAFETEHERRYGYRMDGEEVELVALRLVTSLPTAPPALDEPAKRGGPTAAWRAVWVDVRSQEIDVLDRSDLGAGARVTGPAVVEFADATCFVRPGWRGVIDRAGTLVLERAATDRPDGPAPP